jgi:gliding motility-associated lipoprotein GldD
MNIRIFQIIIIVALGSCQKEYTPKPRGYFRIEFPPKAYENLDMDLPYSFQTAKYSKPSRDGGANSGPGWITLSIPEHKADLHISYAEIDGNLSKYIEESRKLAYGHSIKADAIREQVFINREKQVYGTIYYIEGNAASPIQFFLTDSTSHFLRGALYIREIPNIDSIRPVIEFLRPDIIHLIETTRWN